MMPSGRRRTAPPSLATPVWPPGEPGCSGFPAPGLASAGFGPRLGADILGVVLLGIPTVLLTLAAHWPQAIRAARAGRTGSRGPSRCVRTGEAAEAAGRPLSLTIPID
jgi:hypothetical protein